MKSLQSVKNPAVQSARALDSARERKKQNAFLLDGEHMVGEALRACPQQVRTLFVEEGRDYQSLIDLARGEVYSVPAHVLEAISQVKTSQGIAAVCALPENVPLERMGQRLVLLENVQDPGNVGTVLRTLDAAGFDGCILTPGCADPFGPKALRATMGSAFRVSICMAESAGQAVKWLNQQGYATIAAALDGQPFYHRGPLPEKLCVLIGNEGAGLRADTLSLCTHHYRLPMRGGAESLNAAVAAAIFMYDLTRHLP